MNYTNNSEGIQLCKVELDDYPIVFDNSYFLSYQVRGKLQALAISNPQSNGSDYLKALFAGDELIDFTEVPENNIPISQLKNYQCIFMVNTQNISSGLKDELTAFVKNGGTLVLFPDKPKNYDEYNALLQSLNGNTIARFDTAKAHISEINYNHELYREVFKKQENNADLPDIKGFVVFADQMQRQKTSLLAVQKRQKCVEHTSVWRGQCLPPSLSAKLRKFQFCTAYHFCSDGLQHGFVQRSAAAVRLFNRIGRAGYSESEFKFAGS